MQLEHTAYNVPSPAAAAEWYCQNLSMTVPRKFGPPAHGHFLASARGQVMLEFYRNPEAPVPDYQEIDPLVLHLAFSVADVAAVRAHLLSVGATAEGEISTNNDGDTLAMLRDPWGIPLQLVKRVKPVN